MNRFLRVPERTILSIVVVCGIGVVVGCGGKDDQSTTAETTPTATTATTAATGKPPREIADVLTQQARVIDLTKKKGSKPAPFATKPGRAAPGDFVQFLIKAPKGTVGERLTIVIPKTTGRQISIRTFAGNQRKTTQIAARDKQIGVLDVRYNCQLPPSTFCPVSSIKRTKTSLRMRLKAPSAPIVMTIPIGRPGQEPPDRLLPTSLPAPGSAIRAAVTVRRVGPGVAPGKPASEVTAGSDSTVQALVSPEPNSPEGGTLRIAIPRTSGKSIAVQAGGTARKPASIATIKAKGGLVRIVGVGWSCRLPPATFCPVRPKRTDSGLTLRLGTPRVPVLLSFKLASA